MVAYSFNRMFVDPLVSKRKIGTIRAERKRHARIGEEVQCYQGMRTKSCRLIGRATCTDVARITLCFDDDDPEFEGVIVPGLPALGGLDEFARCDGFDDWAALRGFWRREHPGLDQFEGIWIIWNDTFRSAL